MQRGRAAMPNDEGEAMPNDEGGLLCWLHMVIWEFATPHGPSHDDLVKVIHHCPPALRALRGRLRQLATQEAGRHAGPHW